MRRLAVAAGALALSTLGGCSTGTVDRALFAHTQDETYARVRAAVPDGAPVEAAEVKMQQMGWSCYRADVRSHVIPNNTGRRQDGRTLSCEAHPSVGGYPFSKQYSAEFLIQGDKVGPLQVIIADPGV